MAIVAASFTYVTGAEPEPTLVIYAKVTMMTAGSTASASAVLPWIAGFSQEVLKVISPFGVEASLKAIEELSSGDAAQRAALASKLERWSTKRNGRSNNMTWWMPETVWLPLNWNAAGTKSYMKSSLSKTVCAVR